MEATQSKRKVTDRYAARELAGRGIWDKAAQAWWLAKLDAVLSKPNTLEGYCAATFNFKSMLTPQNIERNRAAFEKWSAFLDGVEIVPTESPRAKGSVSSIDDN